MAYLLQFGIEVSDGLCKCRVAAFLYECQCRCRNDDPPTATLPMLQQEADSLQVRMDCTKQRTLKATLSGVS